MKTLTTLFFSVLTLFISAQSVDVLNSKISWEGKKVTGVHQGEISMKSGSLDFNGEDLAGGRFVLDMSSITCTDLKGKSANDLVGHLKSDDFFSTEKFPEAILTFDNVKHIEGVDYRVTADLTIKGITNPVVFTADMRNGLATAKIKVDRTKYGVKYGSGSFFDNLGDRAIDDIFTVNVSFPYSVK